MHWNYFLGIEATKVLRGFICFEHFENECFGKNFMLKANAVPTIKEQVISDNFTEIDTSIDSNVPITPVTFNENNYFESHDSHFLEASSCSVASRIAIVNDNSYEAPSHSVASAASPASPIAIVNDHCHETASHSVALLTSPIAIVDDHCHETASLPPLSIAIATQKLSECEKFRREDELINGKDAEIRKLRKKLQKAQQKIWYLEKVKQKLDKRLSDLMEQTIINEELFRQLEVNILSVQ